MGLTFSLHGRQIKLRRSVIAFWAWSQLKLSPSAIGNDVLDLIDEVNKILKIEIPFRGQQVCEVFP